MSAFTAREAEVYDRQIRLWGLEAQKRMKDSVVLVAGINGVNAEVVKNLVLSGIGVCLCDPALVTLADLGANFFLTQEDVGKPAAAACLQRVRDLNPLVTVSVCEGAVDTLSDEALAAYTLVCVASTSLPALTALDDRCRRVGVRFIASCSAGLNAFAFFDLATHTFTKSQTKSDGAVSVESVVLEYPSLTHALSVKLGSIKRFPPLLAALLAAAADPTLPAAKEFLAARAVDASDAVITGAIGSWGHVVSPVAGILGGIIGQEIVKAISLKDEPIHNFFLFDGDTCFGTINTIV